MKRLIPLIVIILSLSAGQVFAQKFKYAIPGLDTLERSFIVGGGASTVLRSGQSEVILNNSLASYWIAFHQGGTNSPVLDRFRQTFFSTDLFGFFGLSPSGKFDVGVQARYTRTRLDNAASSSMLKVFEKTEEDPLLPAPTDGGQTIIDSSFGGISLVGVRVRFKPFLTVPGLVLNGGIALSTIRDDRLAKQLDAQTDIFDIGATYYQKLTPRVYYFFGGSTQVLLPNLSGKKTEFSSSLNFFLIHRSPNQKLSFLPGLVYSIRYRKSEFDDHNLIRSAEFLFATLGVQYSINPDVMVFGSGGFPLISKSIPPQIEIVRESYSLFSIGARAVF